jgi:hypothetical protein
MSKSTPFSAVVWYHRAVQFTGSLLPYESTVELLRPLKSRIPELFQLLQPQYLPSISSAIDSAFNKNVGVLCLSEVRDSLLMWGHYTENHEGFVIGFD